MADLTLVSTSDSPEEVMAALTGKDVPAADPKPEGKKDDVPPVAAKVAPVADDADADDDADDAASPDDKTAKRQRYQARIDRLKWEQHQRESEIDRLRAENALLRAPKTGEPSPTAEPAGPPKFTEAKPKIDSFNTVEEFTEALGEWTERKIKFEIKADRDAERASVEASQQNRESDTLLARHLTRIEEFRKTHADYDTVAQQATMDKLPISPMMATHIQHSELGAEILYYLGKNPDECRRIAALGAGPQLVELGELQAEFKREKKAASGASGTVESRAAAADGASPKPRKHTPPPPPIDPVGGSNTATSRALDEVDYQEYKKRRAAENRR